MGSEPFNTPFKTKELQGDLGWLVLDATSHVICEGMDADEAKWLCDRLNANTPAPAEGEREGFEKYWCGNGYDLLDSTKDHKEHHFRTWQAARVPAPVAGDWAAGVEAAASYHDGRAKWWREWADRPDIDGRTDSLSRVSALGSALQHDEYAREIRTEDRQLLIDALNSAEQLMLNGDEHSRGRARDLVIGVRRKLARLAPDSRGG